MSSAGHAAHHYFQTQVRSSSPLELVVMLYDAAIRSTATAVDALDRRDIPARRAAISRALSLVAELQSVLDLERGGALAAELDRLYTWMTDQLVEATVNQAAGPVRQVQRVLETLRDGWHQIATAPRAPESAA
jgi:flagellar protein FliS